MQCPNCDHDAPDIEFGKPSRCPSCGAYYEKALLAKQSRDAKATANAKLTEQEQKEAEKRSRIAREEAALDRYDKVLKEDKQRHAQLAAEKRISDADRSVIVTDIQMPFWSMVRFMVKSTLAAIPALIILLIFALIVTAIFGKLR